MSNKRSIFEEISTDQAAPTAPVSVAPQSNRTAIRIWLGVLLAMVALMVIVGGLTRLTDSGLSITEWNLIIGALPPLSEADWNAAFVAYQTTDEYKLQNNWMTLADFKPIFWWEWGHRFLGRVMGVVWLIPLLFFAATGAIPRGWIGRLIFIGFLGGLQGAIGWWMVYSGLSIRVDVAPYRLATHLGVACLIFALILWYILRLGHQEWSLLQARRRRVPGLAGWSRAVAGLLFLQILLGALVAGVDGGKYFTDWPMMDGQFFAESATEMTPYWSNFFENPGMVQFIHRMTAYALVIVSIIFTLRARKSGHERISFWGLAVGACIVVQVVLGIVTLMHAAPTELALAHQLAALALLAVVMRAKFEVAYPSEQKISA
ncbi:MAG: COX15/CtaA family protein [Pikeienuella sp.]